MNILIENAVKGNKSTNKNHNKPLTRRVKETHINKQAPNNLFSNIVTCEKNFNIYSLKSSNINTSIKTKTSKIDIFINKLNNLRALQIEGLFQSCMIGTFNTSIDFNYKNDSYSLNNYFKCSNRFCVMCSSKHNYIKRIPLTKVIESYSAESKAVVMVTLNLPNYKNQDLNSLLDILNIAYSKTIKSSQFKYNQSNLRSKKVRSSASISEQIKLDGIYKQTELTYSVSNGYNVHNHSLLFLSKNMNEVEINHFKSQFQSIFLKYANTEYYKRFPKQAKTLISKNVKAYSIDVKNITSNAEALAYYLNKKLDISHELVSDIKIAKSDTNYSLNELYELLINKDFEVISKQQILAIVHNILKTFKGRELSQYRLCNQEIKNIVKASKEELKEQNKEFRLKQNRVNYISKLHKELLAKNKYNIIVFHITSSPLTAIKHLVSINTLKSKVTAFKALRMDVINKTIVVSNKSKSILRFKRVRTVDINRLEPDIVRNTS